MQIYKLFIFILSISLCHVQFGMNKVTEADEDIVINPACSPDYEEHAHEAWVAHFQDILQIPMEAEIMQYVTGYVCEQCKILAPDIKEHIKECHFTLAKDFNVVKRRFYRCRYQLCSNARDGNLVPEHLLIKHLENHEKVATQVTYLISQISGTH